MEYLPPCQMDDLLDFSSDIGEDEEEDDDQTKTLPLSLPLHSNNHRRRGAAAVNSLSSSFPGFVEEEELEWISNKDAFPMVESFADFLPNQHPLAPALGITSTTTTTSTANHRSPVSVLENSSSTSLNSSGSNNSCNNNTTTNSISAIGGAMSGLMLSISSSLKAPSRARSKRRRRKRKDLSEWPCWTPQTHTTHHKGPGKPRAGGGTKPSSTLGRKCQHCQAEKTPQWRAGPMGPKTLCNACGVRYKSGRLVPEYRPASSPTFSSELHSNSHRKIVEMRKRGQGPMMTTTMMTESRLKPLG